MGIVETINFAQVSRKNGQATETEHQNAAKMAVANCISIRSFLWSRAFLEIANGDVHTAQEWLKEKVAGFGDYDDNAEAWSTIQFLLADGKMEEGLERASLLREFISQRGDDNSVKWLLPQIDEVLGNYPEQGQSK
jgi:hypothetical protein